MAISFCINQLNKISLIAGVADFAHVCCPDHPISRRFESWIPSSRILSVLDGAALMLAANRKWGICSRILLHPASPAKKIVPLVLGLACASIAARLIAQKVFCWINPKTMIDLPEQIEKSPFVEAYFEASEQHKLDRFYRTIRLIENVALICLVQNPYIYIASLILQSISFSKVPYEHSTTEHSTTLRYDHTFLPFRTTHISLADFLNDPNDAVKTTYSLSKRNGQIDGIWFRKGGSPWYFISATKNDPTQEIAVTIKTANDHTHIIRFKERAKGSIFLANNPIPQNGHEATSVEVYTTAYGQRFKTIKVSFFQNLEHLQQNPAHPQSCSICLEDLQNQIARLPCGVHFTHKDCFIGNIYQAFVQWQNRLEEYLTIGHRTATILKVTPLPKCPICKTSDGTSTIRIFATNRAGIETEVPLSS